MKTCLFLFALLFSHLSATPYSYRITKSHYLFSTYFEMQDKEDYLGKVIG